MTRKERERGNMCIYLSLPLSREWTPNGLILPAHIFFPPVHLSDTNTHACFASHLRTFHRNNYCLIYIPNPNISILKHGNQFQIKVSVGTNQMSQQAFDKNVKCAYLRPHYAALLYISKPQGDIPVVMWTKWIFHFILTLFCLSSSLFVLHSVAGRICELRQQIRGWSSQERPECKYGFAWHSRTNTTLTAMALT